jgi:hypothetical protein
MLDDDTKDPTFTGYGKRPSAEDLFAKGPSGGTNVPISPGFGLSGPSRTSRQPGNFKGRTIEGTTPDRRMVRVPANLLAGHDNNRPDFGDRDNPPDFIADVDMDGNFFSPFQPVYPFGPPNVNYPRAYDYQVGTNLDIYPKRLQLFSMLRTLAAASGVIASVMESRIDEIVALPWKFQLKDAGGKKSEDDPRIKELTQFFEKPDRKIPYPMWQRMIYRDRYTIDAASAFVWKNRLGTKPYAIMALDGATVKVLIDDWGRVPDAPQPAYQQCYSADTEALTRRGWLPYNEIDPAKDEFATRNPVTKVFEWQKSNELVVRDHVGEMYNFHSRAIDILVTEDHRMLIDRLPRGAQGRSTRTGEVVITAHELHAMRSGATKIPITSNWTGVPIADKVFGEMIKEERERRDDHLRELHGAGMSYQAIADQEGVALATAHRANTTYAHGRKPCPQDTLPVFMTGDEYASFMGAYLSEGSCNLSSGATVAISQNDGNRGCAPYRKLLSAIAPGRVRKVGINFLLHSKPLVDYLRQFCHARTKFIPDEIMNAPKDQLALFWEFFWYGDGDKSRQRLFTSSKRMADQLQEIAQKLGFSASVQESGPSQSIIRENGVERIITRGIQYTVSLRKAASALVRHSDKIQYDGKVWCPSVPNGIVYVRRNGLPAWCGNCIKGLPMNNFTEDELLYMPARPRTDFPIGGYSEVEQIMSESLQMVKKTLYMTNFWEKGTIPDVMLGVPPEWTPDQIAVWQASFDALMSGNMNLKSKIRFIPGGMKPFEMKGSAGELLKSEYDEWLTRIVCHAFRVLPKPFVKEPQSRASAEQEKEQIEEQGIQTEMIWWKAFMDRLIVMGWGPDYANIEMVWSLDSEVAATDQATIDSAYLKLGRETINEQRVRAGMDPIEGGDVAMVYTASGAIPLSVLAGQTEMPQAAGAAAGGDDAGASGSKGKSGTGKAAGKVAEAPFVKAERPWRQY